MSGGQVYSVDTSALIDGMERFYPRPNFPALWERIDLLIDDGRMHISEEAWSEATSVDAPVREWCEEEGAGRERSIYATTAAVAAIAGQIGTQFPNWVKQGRKNGADPFVIAVAEVEGGMVISGETNGGPGRLVDLITSEDWVIG